MEKGEGVPAVIKSIIYGLVLIAEMWIWDCERVKAVFESSWCRLTNPRPSGMLSMVNGKDFIRQERGISWHWQWAGSELAVALWQSV